jgi:butyrate kinase
MLTESARMSSATEARFRIPAQPTDRSVKVIDLDTATSADVTRLVNEVPEADLVVMLVSAGCDAQAASTIGQACSEHRVMTHAIVVRAGVAAERELSRTLAQLRPWSLMVVVANGDDDYVEGILRSFR